MGLTPKGDMNMPNMTPVLAMLERVCLDNTITECVVTIKDGVCSCKAMDLGTSVYVEAAAPLAVDDDTMAFGNLPIFIKYLKSYPNIDVTVKRVDNRLTLKPRGGATLKYLLTESDLIPTYDEEWGEESRSAEVIKEFDGKAGLVLTNEALSEFILLAKTFAPKAVELTVSASGVVSATGGNVAEHQFTVELGGSDLAPCTTSLPTKIFLAVLGQLDYLDNPTMLLGEDTPVVVISPEATWVLMVSEIA